MACETRKLIWPREIHKACDLYIKYAQNLGHPFKLSYEHSVKHLSHRIRTKEFVRGYFVDNELKAWLYCMPGKLEYLDEICFIQKIYASELHGYSAFVALKKLHEEMEEEARRLKIRLLITESSPLDEEFVLTKLLERAGWYRRGYMAYKYVSI